MNLKEYIRDIQDFPIDGIVFKDISPLLSNPQAFDYTCEQIATAISGVDKVVALDARGFIFGGAVANMLEVPFVPVRKPGKLPYDTVKVSYDLEYGSNVFEMHTDAISQGDKVAVIDDLLATGGSADAACQLIEKLGGEVESLNFVISLSSLPGVEKLSKYKINSLIEY